MSDAPQRRRRAELSESHLALVIEDLLAAVDAAGDTFRPRPDEPDLRAVLLYGWATGAHGAGEIARRAGADPGLQHLLDDTVPSVATLQRFRDEHRAQLEAFYTQVFACGRAAGLATLGDLVLNGTPRPRATRGSRRPARATADAHFAAWLAAQLLATSRAADAREAATRDALETALPAWARTRAGRRAALRAAAPAGRPAPPAAPAAPAPRGAAVRLTAVLGLVVAGLLLVRWISVVTAPAPTRSLAREPGGTFPTDVPAAEVLAVAPSPTADLSEQIAAHDVALQLAYEALLEDDLVTARAFYFLAHSALPDDDEARDRFRQVETALGVPARTEGWSDALLDLADLRELVPSSPTVLQAYVAALVGAGHEALAEREFRRAADLCGEAVRWFPDRADARQCLAQSGFAPTATRPPPAPPTAPPTATAPTAPTATSVEASPTVVPSTPTPAPAATATPLFPTPTPPVVITLPPTPAPASPAVSPLASATPGL